MREKIRALRFGLNVLARPPPFSQCLDPPTIDSN